MIKASAVASLQQLRSDLQMFFPQFFFLLPHMSYISICRIQNDQLWKWRRGTLHCARKRNGNYGQCQIIELVVRDMLITDGDAEDLSLRTLGDRLSLLLMSCFRGEIVPRKTPSLLQAGKLLACVPNSAWTDRIQLTGTYSCTLFSLFSPTMQIITAPSKTENRISLCPRKQCQSCLSNMSAQIAVTGRPTVRQAAIQYYLST